MHNVELQAKALPDFQQVYDFLKKHYKPSRFEERNGDIWGYDYSRRLTRSAIEDLDKYGKSYVSRFEDRAGDGFAFGRDLVILR
ncbi:hypothetical protein L6R44_10640 [Enterobacter cloacae complex sp. ECC445]|uniref:hypothetical protein n=1 Tax=Enterobacteriaceae TaxID=543 RepID=UPI00192CD3C5|nr:MULTISPECIES: hypothetical protein [Enterobacteriaceae]MCW1830147.1 hypothetical protein [Enterobacter asburiae]MBL5885647.1 hypothetical protein [Lelliottia aquatilis]MBL5923225.1 hypothetical protein [Lelliottia amnigena]MBL5932135.1 hypothetical protein [Lelliottia amnigena]MCG0456562.1 hypothetical protein [Enterobacter cloacae complex sp. ECC445]